MRVDEYQRQAIASDQSRGKHTARYLLLGLFGEAGGVLSAVKKKERDRETAERYLSQVSEELSGMSASTPLLVPLAGAASLSGVFIRYG